MGQAVQLCVGLLDVITNRQVLEHASTNQRGSRQGVLVESIEDKLKLAQEAVPIVSRLMQAHLADLIQLSLVISNVLRFWRKVNLSDSLGPRLGSIPPEFLSF